MEAQLVNGQWRWVFSEETREYPANDFSVTGPGDHRRRPDPSPEEIRRICQKFQASWTDEERIQRWVGVSA